MSFLDDLLGSLKFGNVSAAGNIPQGQPSIYAGPEEWAAYRLQQAEDASIGATPINDPVSPIAALVAGLEQPAAHKGLEALGTKGNPIPPAGGDFQSQTANTLASVQDRVNWELQNNPSFLAAINGKDSAASGPPEDPLKADKNGWNLPKTGKVNTTGAEQRINARAQAEGTGVTATRDANGQMVISNIPSGQAAPSQLAPNVSLSLTGSVDMLKNATDADAARGIMANIRQSAAQEEARIQGQANEFAGQKVGLPNLVAELQKAEMADKADPSWYPGIGDSPITASIRSQVNVARTSAEQESKRFLESNTNMASLKATLATASAEMTRLDRISTSKANLADNLAARRDSAAITREQKDQEAIDAILPTLTPNVRDRLAVLNPQYESTGNADKDMVGLVKAASKNKARMEVLAASDSDIPVLALNGNVDAVALVVAGEMKNPGATKELVESKLMKIREAAMAPDFAKKMIAFKYGGKTESEDAKKELMALNVGKMDTDPAAKATNRQIRFNAALEMERKATTSKFVGDTSSWGSNDPEFIAAQQKAFQTSGNKSMENVLTAYVGDFRGLGAVSKLNAFNSLIDQATSGQKSSVFGQPDTMAIKAMVIRKAMSYGLLSRISESISNNVSSSMDFISALTGFDAMNARSAAASPIDPATGQIRNN